MPRAQNGQLVDAVDPATGATVRLAPPPGLAAALAELGLGRALGSLRLLQLDPPQARPLRGRALCSEPWRRGKALQAQLGLGAALGSLSEAAGCGPGTLLRAGAHVGNRDPSARVSLGCAARVTYPAACRHEPA